MRIVCEEDHTVMSDVVRKSLKELFGRAGSVVKIPNSVDMEKISRLRKEKVEFSNKMLFKTSGRWGRKGEAGPTCFHGTDSLFEKIRDLEAYK